MNRNQVSALSAKGAKLRNQNDSHRFLFRDEELVLVKASQQPSLELRQGGLTETHIWTVYFPASVQPPPKKKEEIKEISTGLILRIIGVRQAMADRATSHEHIVTCETA